MQGGGGTFPVNLSEYFENIKRFINFVAARQDFSNH
jgi:K+-transporting ATPase A subunit